MDIRGIKYFISAAECLNFTRAARECFITQTAMSQHIANMEKELGFQLFRRNNRNVELTPAGRDFYEQKRNGYLLSVCYEDVGKKSDSFREKNGNDQEETVRVKVLHDGQVWGID